MKNYYIIKLVYPDNKIYYLTFLNIEKYNDGTPNVEWSMSPEENYAMKFNSMDMAQNICGILNLSLIDFNINGKAIIIYKSDTFNE